jgi:malate dehydrogenase (oxaloacetate-decarboxylating)(NADP+)
MCDSKGVIRPDRKTWTPTRRASPGTPTTETLADALRGADVFVGLSIAGP